MTGINVLPYTRQVLAGLASVVLVGLAVNAFNASASISRIPSDVTSSLSAPGPRDAGYPVRLTLASRDAAAGPSYPLRVPMTIAPAPKAQSDQKEPNVLIAAAMQMPAKLYDVAARFASEELARIEQEQKAETGAEPVAASRLVGLDPVRAVSSGRPLDDVINVKFDLAAQLSAAQGLAIRKPLFVNGAASGGVTLRIVRDTRIVARLKDLKRAFGDDLPAGLGQVGDEEGYVDFDDLRTAGIAVRYDAARDAVQMTAQAETG